jgi:hypothetical protein
MKLTIKGDGLNANIYLDDKELHMVQAVSLDMTAGSLPEAVITFIPETVDLEIDNIDTFIAKGIMKKNDNN